MVGAIGILQCWILHSPGLHKKNHFLQWLISQDRNNIFEVFQSLKSSTHYVLLAEQGGPRFVEHHQDPLGIVGIPTLNPTKSRGL